MKFSSRHLTLAVAAGVAVLLAGLGMTGHASAQTAGKAPAPTGIVNTRVPAGMYFKAVNTSTLKVLTVDDFLQSMGVMAAGLGFDCSDCHPGAGSDTVNWVIDTPKKITARKMVEMVAVINKTNFGGAQMVTCWTCHHGREVPTTSITLDHLYGPPYDEKDDIVLPGKGVPSATQTLDKYIAASGGVQKLAALKSYIATGGAAGYEKLGGGGTFQIFAQAPDKHAVIVSFKDHPERGDNSRIFDGKQGWLRTPRGLFTDYELVGIELNGAKTDALLAFPGQIKTALTGMHSGFTDTIDDKAVEVVQGTGPGDELVTLYFDQKSGLLTRVVRFGKTPIGRSPTQMDYADYRDVGGYKFPFKYTFSWLDGKDSFQLSEVKVNVPIDASKFGKPGTK
jgi:photosynthetic reaction center cytochrome c subunit